ncbi:flagellin [Thioalkalivibrio sp. XN279]|uniref:flagellin N-terminal helical domain-containing protein n=1 Tax=Thioalkalivibrio sp. XN279 TaxID=2714953 RepID=UPI00140C3B02|nr:flagellin [Thioalkalivibrio sp. XN279]
MAQVINTNILSLNAQRNLNSTSSALQTSLQRLSSGLRINSAKDDAAGLAISERFSTQIRGLNQAVRNANDGISLAQTAEGALAEVSNNLQRIRELAVQSRNATNSASDRAALDAEVQQRLGEIQRVASQTEFNGLKLLDGSFKQQVFQVGANQGQTISVSSISSATAQDLGLNGGTLRDYTSTGGAMTGTTSDTDLSFTVNGSNFAVSGASSAVELANNINASGAGIAATATSASVSGTVVQDGTVTNMTVNGIAVAETAITGDVAVGAGNLRDAINTALRNAGVTNITATADATSVTVTSSDGSNVEIGGSTSAASGFSDAITRGGVSLSSTGAYTIAGDDSAKAGLTDGAAAGSDTAYSKINVTTAAQADVVLRVVDGALNSVNGSRASLGAVQNRFESVIANLSTVSENLTSSRSRILDADFAAETAALTRAQILQQAGISVLSQANAAPQSVLSLLR